VFRAERTFVLTILLFQQTFFSGIHTFVVEKHFFLAHFCSIKTLCSLLQILFVPLNFERHFVLITPNFLGQRPESLASCSAPYFQIYSSLVHRLVYQGDRRLIARGNGLRLLSRTYVWQFSCP
jgi:hypothetical protein